MTDTIPQKMVKWLFYDTDSLSLGFGGWVKLLWATLVTADDSFTLQFFNALKEKITVTCQDVTLTPEQKETICYNALSYLAFSHPQEGSQIDMNGVTYTIHKIKLTSGWFSSPYYAYGLISDKSSILIFQGTTVPSDRGFLAGILGDTMPGGAVGTFLYQRGKHKIQSWIDSEYQRTGRPVICTGQSLGGAMSIHSHVHQPEKVDFYVLNPPTLTSREEKIYERNKSQNTNKLARTLKVITHRSDPVFYLGSNYLPPGTKIFKHGLENENIFIAHAKAPNFKNPISKTSDTFVDYERQKLNTWMWKIQKACLFVGALLCQMLWLIPRLVIHTVHHIRQFCQTKKPIVKNLPESTTNQQSKTQILSKEAFTTNEPIESSQLILNIIGHKPAAFNKHNLTGLLNNLKYPTTRMNHIGATGQYNNFGKQTNFARCLNNNFYSQGLQRSFLNLESTKSDINLVINEGIKVA
ncbi:Uncharacterised protein [Legionella busanensis]|uniref:Lipase n=1 Tax=Legionella busanensis TaxID=190655 RepID=A0A378JPC7_9GAMM|nr:hypothetical protein [Legionella busanensis]STX52571.1 Uncharacterised protein [Legionella busanensis]